VIVLVTPFVTGGTGDAVFFDGTEEFSDVLVALT
jgi:hypothetical protein